MHCLRRGANYGAPQRNDDDLIKGDPKEPSNAFEKFFSDLIEGKDYFEKSTCERDYIVAERRGMKRIL